MTPSSPANLPPHIQARLGVAQMDEDCKRTVALAEAFGLRVEVRRLQLGRTTAPEYNTWRVVYTTSQRERSP